MSKFVDPSGETERIPIVEETLQVGKRQVETGRVRVSTHVLEHVGHARGELFHDRVSVERVPVNREITAIPEPRQEGDTTILPVVEEVLVVERRLMLREEVRITRTRSIEAFDRPVVLRTMHAEVEREDGPARDGPR